MYIPARSGTSGQSQLSYLEMASRVRSSRSGFSFARQLRTVAAKPYSAFASRSRRPRQASRQPVKANVRTLRDASYRSLTFFILRTWLLVTAELFV